MARDAGITLVSAGLLIAAFPSRDFGFLAWVALVPFFLAVSRQSFAGALLLSVFFGSVFLPGIFNWILELWYYRWYHHLLLAVYFGFYFAVFGGVVAFLSKRLGAITALWAAPFLWVTLEYLRSNFFFLALPWGLLAHTQYRYPVVIQMVSIFGTYGLSFLIVFFNAALSIGILFYLKGGRAKQYTTASSKGGPNIVCLIAAGLYIFWMLGFGIREIWQPTPGKAFEISLIQANIPQSKKWDPEYADEIMKAYSDLTRKASRTRPDLIVWPETATPGAITRDGALFDRVTALVQKTGTPLLVGSAEFQKFQKAEAVETRLTNSAFLLNPSKEEVNLQRYDKIRLFPFGEYLPYKETLPWNWIRVSSLSQYAPGTEHTVFQLPPHRFKEKAVGNRADAEKQENHVFLERFWRDSGMFPYRCRPLYLEYHSMERFHGSGLCLSGGKRLRYRRPGEREWTRRRSSTRGPDLKNQRKVLLQHGGKTSGNALPGR
ncbi:MAG: apolipoprotein N-acyltransferase [Deltaproteobacteria bacterium]|nr:apolipoprotein N-acyltransferase [Deltaproteobacteria bacterium]